MWCRLRPVSLWVLAAALAGCSGYSPKSNFTLPSVSPFGNLFSAPPAEGKATVLFSSTISGLSCAEKRVVIGQAEGDGFRTVMQEKIDSGFGRGEGAAVVDLDPGTYHVVEVACRNGAYVVHAGANPVKDAVPWQAERWTRSLASFTLASGDVLDAGELVITPVTVSGFGAGINGRKADIAVRPSPEGALAEIVRERPELAPRLHTSWMQIADVSQLALAKCRLDAPRQAPVHDGSSKLTDALAEHPEAAPVVKSIGTATTTAESCVPEAGGGAALGSLQ